MKRLVLVFLFLTTLLFALQKGDSLDQTIIQKLQIQKDKIYIIDFFASWCVSCKKELPSISKLNSMLDHNKIEIIGIDVDKDTQKGKRFQQDLNLDFKIVNDPSSQIISIFQPVGIPALYIIKNQKIVSEIIGAKDHIDKLLLSKIKELL